MTSQRSSNFDMILLGNAERQHMPRIFLCALGESGTSRRQFLEAINEHAHFAAITFLPWQSRGKTRHNNLPNYASVAGRCRFYNSPGSGKVSTGFLFE
jgi:hypothetical protein